VHRQWFVDSAMDELLETDFAVAEKDLLLATEIGPLRQFNLAHPRLMVSGQGFPDL
jgi:hypothetical protein